MKTTAKPQQAHGHTDRGQMLDEAIRFVGLGVWKWDEAGQRVLYCSEEAAAILGMTVDEVMHTPMTYSAYMERIHPDDRERIDREVSAFYQSLPASKAPSTLLDINYRLIRADGEIRHLREQSAMLTDEKGNVTQPIGTIQDVTREKELEIQLTQSHLQLEELVRTRTRELRLSEDKFRRAAKIANLCHWQEDASTREWTETSDNTEEMLGVKPELLFGDLSKYATYIHPEDVDRVLFIYETNMGEGLPYELGYRWCHPDGTIRHFWETAEPITNEQGDITGWRGTTQDVTPLKTAEEKAIAAKRDAEIASRAKTEMLATMSHELRTPLNAILGFSQMILGEVFGPLGNEKYLEYAADIHNSGAYLLEVVDDILDVSAIEAGETDIHPIEINPCRPVQNMLRLIQPRATKGKLALVNTVPPNGPRLLADERRFSQIVLNLLSNAVKFTEPGGTVEITSWLDSSGDLLLSVRDSGIGMSKADLKQAMISFKQIKRDAGGKHEGTGLGLPLTEALIKLHDGTMNIDSTPGKGTTVTVRFPKERVLPR